MYLNRSVSIIGNVDIDNPASITVNGGTGKTFGSWTGGTITIGNGNLAFAGGNTALGENISVDGGAGTVTNKGLAADRDAGDARDDRRQFHASRGRRAWLGLWAATRPGDYGALKVSKLTTLDGGLAIDLTDDFMLATQDRFDILGFGSRMGRF